MWSSMAQLSTRGQSTSTRRPTARCLLLITSPRDALAILPPRLQRSLLEPMSFRMTTSTLMEYPERSWKKAILASFGLVHLVAQPEMAVLESTSRHQDKMHSLPTPKNQPG